MLLRWEFSRNEVGRTREGLFYLNVLLDWKLKLKYKRSMRLQKGKTKPEKKAIKS